MRFMIIMLISTLAVSAGCSRSVSTPMEEARESFKNGAWSDVIDQCGAIVASDADNVDAYMLRGRAGIELDKAHHAVDDFSRVIKLAADDPEGYYFRAIAYRMLGNEDLAYEDEKYAKTIDPDYLISFPHGTSIGQRDLLVLDGNTMDDESEEDKEELASGHDAEDDSEKENGIRSGQTALAFDEPPMDEATSPSGKLWTPADVIGMADLMPSRFLGDSISRMTSMGRTAVEPELAKSDEDEDTEKTEGDLANSEKEPKPSSKLNPERDPLSPTGAPGRLGAYAFHVPFTVQSIRATGINARMPEQPQDRNSAFSNNATSGFSPAGSVSYFGNPNLNGRGAVSPNWPSSKWPAVAFYQTAPTTGISASTGNPFSGGRFSSPIVTHTPRSSSGVSGERPLAPGYRVLFPQGARSTGITPSLAR